VAVVNLELAAELRDRRAVALTHRTVRGIFLENTVPQMRNRVAKRSQRCITAARVAFEEEDVVRFDVSEVAHRGAAPGRHRVRAVDP
jgi:hypothetical protein